jgi:general nucleoside transport system permease protein
MDVVFEIIFSTSFVFSVLRVATPLIFAAMAALVVRRSGIICIAFEAMMLFAALGGVIGSAYSQSLFIGLITGVFAGMLIAVLFAYFVLVLDANVVLTGLALNIFAGGATIFVMYLLTGSKGQTIALRSLSFPSVSIPLLRDIPILNDMFNGHNLMTYFALLSVVLVNVLIFKTRLGLRIRSVGENPHAAESVGISVVKTQLIALTIGGLLASFGGLFMSMGYLPLFVRDMVSGRGFIGIAANNLGGGIPFYTLISALFFGAANAVGNVMQTLGIPSEFMQMLPYLVTIFALIFVGGFKRESKPRLAKIKELKEKLNE